MGVGSAVGQGGVAVGAEEGVGTCTGLQVGTGGVAAYGAEGEGEGLQDGWEDGVFPGGVGMAEGPAGVVGGGMSWQAVNSTRIQGSAVQTARLCVVERFLTRGIFDLPRAWDGGRDRPCVHGPNYTTLMGVAVFPPGPRSSPERPA